MPLPDFAPLPEMGVAHDRVAVLVEVDAHILFLRRMAHTGTILCLPGGWREGSESLESACLRTATREIRDAVRELSRQIHVEPHDDRVALQIRGNLSDHPFGRLGRKHCQRFTTSTQPGLSASTFSDHLHLPSMDV